MLLLPLEIVKFSLLVVLVFRLLVEFCVELPVLSVPV